MRVCLSGRILEGSQPRQDLEDFLAMARECGYDGVGLRDWQIPDDLTDRQVKDLQKLFTASGLSVCSITCRNRDSKSLLDLAQALGAGVLQSGLSPEMLAVLADAPALNILCGPQMHSGGLYENVEQAALNLMKIPDRRCGVIVEPANLMFCGTVWNTETFRPLKDRIIGCNLQSLVTGEGDAVVKLTDGSQVRYKRVSLADNHQIKLDEFIKSLRFVGYDDFINVIEPVNPSIPTRQLAAESARFIRDAIERCGPSQQGDKVP